MSISVAVAEDSKYLPALARVTRRDRCVTHFQFRDRVNFPVGATLQRRSKMFARQQRRLVKMTGVQHQPAGHPHKFALQRRNLMENPVGMTCRAHARSDLAAASSSAHASRRSVVASGHKRARTLYVGVARKAGASST